MVTSKSKKARLRTQVQALQAEMEIAQYDVNHQGQARRKVSRPQSKVRTIKRKALDAEDAQTAAIVVCSPDKEKKRLRGSKIAMEDDIVNSSLIFGSQNDNDDNENEIENNDQNDEDENDIHDSDFEEFDDDNMDHDIDIEEEDNSDEEYQDDDDNQDEDEDEDDKINDKEQYEMYADELGIQIENDHDEDNYSSNPNQTKHKNKPKSSHPKSESSSKQTSSKKRTMFRLKNFKSHKMAQRHGAALGAHARGLTCTAIHKLKEVSAAAPIAPQLYSSLGLVYETLLRDQMDKNIIHSDQQLEWHRNHDARGNLPLPQDKSQSGDITMSQKLKELNDRLHIAKKSFGSYHVAALLCKLDYTLWVRAGDAALSISSLHLHFMSLAHDIDYVLEKNSLLVAGDNATTNSYENTQDDLNEASDCEKTNPTLTITLSTPEEYTNYHKKEYLHWLEESRDDYQAADNLRPPGITVPAKLASVQIELGNLSEALTILTDMKNNELNNSNNNNINHPKRRSELERSYTAWILYANLMLRIGHEITQWNKGNQTNDNYMFRRWLRKYSHTFDWKERRLQALCMALEAAAGSSSCKSLMSWTRCRMKTKDHSDGDNDKSRWNIGDAYECDERVHTTEQDQQSQVTYDNDHHDANAKGKSKEDTVFSSEYARTTTNIVGNSLEELTESFQIERTKLLTTNKMELEEFDKVTKSMNIRSGSLEKKQREEERKIMIKKHKEMVFKLVSSFQSQKLSSINNKISAESDGDNIDAPLPMTASCAAVSDIASQLIKLCLGMGLYHGGKLAAEAVSKYMQARAARIQLKIATIESYEREQALRRSNFVQLEKESYDDVNDQSSDVSDEEDNIFLSDDEDFISSSSDEVISAMKQGVLPTELQILYGLSLIGEGNNNYIATKLLLSLENLEYDDIDNLLLSRDPAYIVHDTPWFLFRRAMTEPFQKSSAFAFTGDLIHEIGKEKEYYQTLLPIFERYLDDFKERIGENILKENNHYGSDDQIINSILKSNYLKIFLATLRYKVLVVENGIISKLPFNKDYDFDDIEKVLIDELESCVNCLDSIIKSKSVLWETPSDDGTLKAICTETLSIVSGSISAIITLLPHFQGVNKFLWLAFNRFQVIISWICQVDAVNDTSISSTNNDEYSDDSWRHFPIPSSWQTARQQQISKRTYNLCVSTNVSAFSGWEKEEFSLKLLKHKYDTPLFGVNVKGIVTAGYVSDTMEKLLIQIWRLIEQNVASLSSLDFENGLVIVKKSDWYLNSIQKWEKAKKPKVAMFGEDYALNILVCFAYLSLHIATYESNKSNRNSLLKDAIGIAVPVSQFSLDQKLWESNLGTNSIENNRHNDIDFTPNIEYAKTPSIKSSNNAKSKSSQKKSTAKCKVQKQDETGINPHRTPLSKLIKVPSSALLHEWKRAKHTENNVDGCGSNNDNDNDEDDDISHHRRLNKWSNKCSGPAILAMKKVDYMIKKLRQCSTIYSLQKASIQVAAALLDVSMQKECNDPFLCMHQAAIFASNGSKGGNHDEIFKKPLASKRDCSVSEALNILGRADCLRAIHFTDEAMYLISYVADVCRLHRDRQETDLEWNAKWRVVGIYMYTMSIALDATICSLMEGVSREEALDSWDKSVRAEIGRARSDAIVVNKTTSAKGVSRANRSRLPKNKSASTSTSTGIATIGLEQQDESFYGDKDTNASWYEDEDEEEEEGDFSMDNYDEDEYEEYDDEYDNDEDCEDDNIEDYDTNVDKDYCDENVDIEYYDNDDIDVDGIMEDDLSIDMIDIDHKGDMAIPPVDFDDGNVKIYQV